MRAKQRDAIDHVVEWLKPRERGKRLILTWRTIARLDDHVNGEGFADRGVVLD